MIMSKVNFDTFLQWVIYHHPSVWCVCGFFFKSEVISQNRWWNVHLQKWCSRLFDKNITMPDWLQFILSSSILTVLIWTFFLFFLPALFANTHPSQISYAGPVTNAEFLVPAVYRYCCIDCLRVSKTIIHWQNKVCLLFHNYFNVFYKGCMGC